MLIAHFSGCLDDSFLACWLTASLYHRPDSIRHNPSCIAKSQLPKSTPFTCQKRSGPRSLTTLSADLSNALEDTMSNSRSRKAVDEIDTQRYCPSRCFVVKNTFCPSVIAGSGANSFVSICPNEDHTWENLSFQLFGFARIPMRGAPQSGHTLSTQAAPFVWSPEYPHSLQTQVPTPSSRTAFSCPPDFISNRAGAGRTLVSSGSRVSSVTDAPFSCSERTLSITSRAASPDACSIPHFAKVLSLR